ncbi:arylamine N-acetyltransferase, pineal gland isozyme NAT-10-like isoform X2 [Lates japonicus]|uniref:Nuclear envelope phosphatase-regulatory subunit 1 n=1 Tax=Lates japonicus TaxID=270547 RepID=A0AAD3MQR9_LATJO|nr:arylamine N-acetyltransferase, pineal gland isozyme NAT-10-like isoform X2 [Lates japonicus]
MDLEVIFNKIVRSGRGGWCLENNSLFGWVLRQMGYNTTTLGSKVFNSTINDFGPNDTHLINKAAGVFRLIEKGDFWVLEKTGRKPEVVNPEFAKSNLVNRKETVQIYCFTLVPREADHFFETNHTLQTDPTVLFTNMSICSLQTPTGFRALIGWTYSEVTYKPEEGVDVFNMKDIPDEEIEQILREKFNKQRHPDTLGRAHTVYGRSAPVCESTSWGRDFSNLYRPFFHLHPITLELNTQPTRIGLYGLSFCGSRGSRVLGVADMNSLEQAEDLKAFERRLTEYVSCLQPATGRWRMILIVVSVCTATGAWNWLIDPDTQKVSFFSSLWNHPFFTISCITLIALFFAGIHKRVVAPIAARCRTVLAEYNMSCDDTGKLILKPRPNIQ